MPTVGSLCSGIGGLDRGLHRAGWTDLRWACERVPHRRAVLRRHWGADLRIFDDLEQLDPAELEPVDLLAAGTPCPDFSHAKAVRAGLAGDKSRLFWDFIRVRDHLEPDWTIWENVDGALSSNQGVDFALVLGAFVGAPVNVPQGGWPRAGVVTGPWGGCVWRVLDAQHFGTPQRRHRVFVVGCLGGPCPPEILLERARSGGDSAPLRATPQDAARALGERVAGTLLNRANGRGFPSDECDGHGAYVAAGEPVVIAPDVANTLVASGGGRDPLDGNLVFNVASYERGTIGARLSDTAAALRSAATTDDPGTVVVPFRKAQKAHDAADSERWEPAEVAGTLRASTSGPGTTHEMAVLLVDGVRRLTPTECERLQGLPDGWTIPFGPSLLNQPAWHELDAVARVALTTPWDPPDRLDTPRRSGCGDAVNAAVAEWIGRRLHDVIGATGGPLNQALSALVNMELAAATRRVPR